MARKASPTETAATRRMRGFEAASALVARRVQSAGETRGFAVSRLLTRWHEIAGADLAAITRPVKVGYGRGGLGATLTLLVSAAHAPLVEMRKEALRERVNGVYGYNAISRIHLTQTAPTGFAEGQAQFTPAPSAAPEAGNPPPGPQAQAAASGVADDGLRKALERLAQNIMSKSPAAGG